MNKPAQAEELLFEQGFTSTATEPAAERLRGCVSLAGLIANEIAVGEILRPVILKCGPDTEVCEAARLMNEAHVSSILVVAASCRKPMSC